MHFQTTIFAAALMAATSVYAAPTTAAAIPNWTLTSVNRACDSANDKCVWTFGINTNTGAAATPCTFAITGANASEGNLTTPILCGAFKVTAGWSGQFGPGNGFTTLSVFDTANSQIAWPAYTDKQLANGAVVKPDMSWAVTQM
ncbi:hypothetical protein F5Y16DRAFT_380208 [Xylariaceae sp. FL0255]|nr:hypothetical protein F5Y16DRAFT_380208 [Xylariaceae sp. FL0255]